MILNQIIRFFVVGVMNTFFGYLCYAVFIYFGFDYRAAVFFATIIGVAFNYFSIGILVFDTLDHTLLLKFISVYIFIYLVNIFFIGYLKSFGHNDYFAGLISLIPSSALSFILNKFLVFRSHK